MHISALTATAECGHSKAGQFCDTSSVRTAPVGVESHQSQPSFLSSISTDEVRLFAREQETLTFTGLVGSSQILTEPMA